MEGPGGEGGDESCVFEGVFGVRRRRWRRREREVGGGEEKGRVLGLKVEHVVDLGLPFFDNSATGGALCYVPPCWGGCAPPA